MSADCLTHLQRENIIDLLFDDFDYRAALRDLRVTEPDFESDLLHDVVRQMYHELIDWSSNI